MESFSEISKEALKVGAGHVLFFLRPEHVYSFEWKPWFILGLLFLKMFSRQRSGCTRYLAAKILLVKTRPPWASEG